MVMSWGLLLVLLVEEGLQIDPIKITVKAKVNLSSHSLTDFSKVSKRCMFVPFSPQFVLLRRLGGSQLFYLELTSYHYTAQQCQVE
jgi:hypothetical protein